MESNGIQISQTPIASRCDRLGQLTTKLATGFGLKPKQLSDTALELGPVGIPIPQAAGLPGADTDPTLCRLFFIVWG